jgi:hypothetical protein
LGLFLDVLFFSVGLSGHLLLPCLIMYVS